MPPRGTGAGSISRVLRTSRSNKRLLIQAQAVCCPTLEHTYPNLLRWMEACSCSVSSLSRALVSQTAVKAPYRLAPVFPKGSFIPQNILGKPIAQAFKQLALAWTLRQARVLYLGDSGVGFIATMMANISLWSREGFLKIQGWSFNFGL